MCVLANIKLHAHSRSASHNPCESRSCKNTKHRTLSNRAGLGWVGLGAVSSFPVLHPPMPVPAGAISLANISRAFFCLWCTAIHITASLELCKGTTQAHQCSSRSEDLQATEAAEAYSCVHFTLANKKTGLRTAQRSDHERNTKCITVKTCKDLTTSWNLLKKTRERL